MPRLLSLLLFLTSFLASGCLFGSRDGIFAELFEEFFKFERCFAGTCACGLVSCLDLCGGIFGKSLKTGSNLFNESFHWCELLIFKIV